MKKTTINIFSTIITVLLIVNCIYLSIATSLTEESIKTNIKKDLLSGFIYDDNGNKTEIFKTILKLTKLDEDTIIKLMENKTVDEKLTDIVNSIYDYNITGDPNVKYTNQEIIDLIENNIDKVSQEINYSITKEERKEAIQYTKDNIDYIIDTIYKTDIGDYKHD